MPKVIVNNGQYKITIPKDLAESRGWTKNTRIKFCEDLEGNIFLKVIDSKDEKGARPS